jgi:hypothetical protein
MANETAVVQREQAKSSIPAAYLPFKTFLGAVEALEHGIPKKIDRTIWRSQSGVTQSQIMMALRFFGFLDDQDQPTQALQRFVENKDRRPEMVSSLLRHSYKSLIEHDLTKMTPKMLADEMENYNVSGDTKRKAIAFFLRAAQFADVPMHPLLSSQMRNTAPGPRKRRASQQRVAKDGVDAGDAMEMSDSAQVQRGDVTAVPLQGGGGKITLIIDANLFQLHGKDRDFVFGLIDKVREYQSQVETINLGGKP